MVQKLLNSCGVCSAFVDLLTAVIRPVFPVPLLSVPPEKWYRPNKAGIDFLSADRYHLSAKNLFL
jgi:hypothetical protein